MTLPYELHVEFEELADDGTLAGTVSVRAREGCTCRKLLLRLDRRHDGDGELQVEGPPHKLVDWDEWWADETYTYPFSVDLDGAPAAGLTTEVHRIGEWEPDPEQVWLVPQGAKPVATGAQPHQEEIEPKLVPNSETPIIGATEEEPLIQDVILEFDRGDRDFAFGDEISGTVTFIPAQDLVGYRLELSYQWRTHGQTERRSGERHRVIISPQLSWNAGRRYRAPFAFSIPSGPRTSHGHGEKLDWYVWPVLTLENGDPVDFLLAETEIALFPSLEGETGLVVEKQEIRSDTLVSSLAVLTTSLIGVALLVLNWRWIWDFYGRGGLAEALAILAGAAPFLLVVHSARNLLHRGIAEYRLGTVHLIIGGMGEVQAIVSVRPRRKSLLNAIRMKLRSVERTRVGQGSSATTKERTLFRESAHLDVEEVVVPDTEWSGSLSIPLRSDLPTTDKYSFGNTTVSIDWHVEIEILQDGWRKWHSKSQIRVSDLRRK